MIINEKYGLNSGLLTRRSIKITQSIENSVNQMTYKHIEGDLFALVTAQYIKKKRFHTMYCTTFQCSLHTVNYITS